MSEAQFSRVKGIITSVVNLNIKHLELLNSSDSSLK